jgi:hypothetical protein
MKGLHCYSNRYYIKKLKKGVIIITNLCHPPFVSHPHPRYLDTLPPTTYNYSICAGMAEMADAADLKSAGEILVGSSPSPGTIVRL